jgi:hypothetical protein
VSALRPITDFEEGGTLKPALVLLACGLLWATASVPARLAAQNAAPQDAAPAFENFELSLFPGAQLRGEDSAIRILRLGLYNRNVSVHGLDIGLINQNTAGFSKGLQFGIVGLVEGGFAGWQNNLVNVVHGETNGVQGVAFYNAMNYGEAVQIGFLNRATNISGFQLGIVNFAENMYGVQIGLINIISGKESLQFLPIVNWSF